MPGVAESSTDLYAATEGLAPGELVAIDADRLGLPDDCLLVNLGISPTHVGRGACRATMKVGRGHLNQRGTVQAGAVVAFADAVAGWASYAAVEGGGFATVDLTCHLLWAIREGDELLACASPVHLGRRTLVIEAVILHLDDEQAAQRRPLARFTCTQLVLGQ